MCGRSCWVSTLLLLATACVHQETQGPDGTYASPASLTSHSVPYVLQPGTTMVLTNDLLLTQQVLPDHTGIEGMSLKVIGQGHRLLISELRQDFHGLRHMVIENAVFDFTGSKGFSFVACESIEFKRCVFIPDDEWLGAFFDCSGIRFDSCTFHSPAGKHRGSGLLFHGIKNHAMVNNIIRGPFKIQLEVEGQEEPLTFAHNTYVGRKGSGFPVFGLPVGDVSPSLNIANCIFVDAGPVVMEGENAVQVSGSNNLLWSCDYNNPSLKKARFANPLLDESLKLLPGSPAIDAGAGQGQLVPFDFEGDYRGLRPDIVADEFAE